MHLRRFAPGFLAAILLAVALPITADDEPKPIERFTAFAASLGTGRTGIVDIAIYRWSTDEEREKLLTTLQEFGTEKLVDALMSIQPRVGFIKGAQTRGYDLYYARDTQNPDGSRKVVVATNRELSFQERKNNTRSTDYQVTLVELHFPAKGKGEGKMVKAAKISWDTKEHKIEIENYENQPIALMQVISKKP